MRHLSRGKRLKSGLMSDEAWCGAIQVTGSATNVAEVECPRCLDAIIEAGIQARRRKDQLASNERR